jgi:hypothetical protein
LTRHVSPTLTPVRPTRAPAPSPVRDPGLPRPAGHSVPTRPAGPARSADTAPLLIAVLTVQAALSLRLVWSNTALLYEATYLYVGHVEVMHWLHGTSVPAYATYLSGAPVIYPPLAALAASVGSLAGARLLSLAFMLSATALLWGTTTRLFGRPAALLAALLFAVLGPTQFLGALATYDAMALFLLTAAVWCVVRAGDRDDSTLLLVAGAALLALANATKYATGLFDPAVIALGGLAIAERRGVKAAMARAGYLTAITLGLISVLLAIGGSWYLTGVLSTTVARAAGGNPPTVILADSAKWVALICAIGALGALGVALCVVRRGGRAQALILLVLVASGVAAPLNQARIHTLTSLSKHVDFGAWFAAAAASYAITQVAGCRAAPGCGSRRARWPGWRPWRRRPSSGRPRRTRSSRCGRTPRRRPRTSPRSHVPIRATTWPRATTSRPTTWRAPSPGSAGRTPGSSPTSRRTRRAP